MTKIKICGLFRKEDIAYVNEAMPDWCGFVIDFPKSHRNVTPVYAGELRKKLDKGIVPVGVFVNCPPELVADLYEKGTLAVSQLHGQEDDAYIKRLRSLAPGLKIWKAFRIRTEKDLQAALKSTADMVLLDNGYGTGEAFDWKLIDGFSRPYLLAGGLTPENIPAAIAALHPYGVDISSGVETAGGQNRQKRKDREKILAAVDAARKED